VTLGAFAVAVGVPPRWVLNTLARLGVPRRYDEPLARRLALARTLQRGAGFALPRGWVEAARILAEADYFADWTVESDDGVVTILVHLPRFFTDYQVRLAAARLRYEPKRPGRKARRHGSAVREAARYGWDLTLLDGNLRVSEEERLRRLDDSADELDAVRGTAQRSQP